MVPHLRLGSSNYPDCAACWPGSGYTHAGGAQGIAGGCDGGHCSRCSVSNAELCIACDLKEVNQHSIRSQLMGDEPFQATQLWWSKELETLCFCHAVLRIKDVNTRAAASIDCCIASFSGVSN